MELRAEPRSGGRSVVPLALIMVSLFFHRLKNV
jgi:hypothetical protein